MTVGASAALASPFRAATQTPEARGVGRDEVRLLTSGQDRDEDLSFLDLPSLLHDGDLLVVNDSATIPASVPARGPDGAFLLNLSTEFGPGLWLAEPRHSVARPGPLALPDGTRLDLAGAPARIVARYPGIARLAFVRIEGDVPALLARAGRPIRYGYLEGDYPLAEYQTAFARVPGSVEMPSAARPFTPRVLAQLGRRGIRFAHLTLHCGVSSLENGDDVTGAPPILPEPYEVPSATAEAVESTRRRGHRVLAVGTTVVRALETATTGCGVRASRGFTRRYLAPPHRIRSVDGLLTGFHTAGTTHLALLESLAGPEMLARSYAHARREGYLWHEFGDVQLIVPGARP